jgi:ParB/RepB/Spo0J family partition protein
MRPLYVRIPIKEIRIKKGHRATDPKVVASIAVSIKSVGLNQPIGVTKGMVGYFLAFGAHRLAAMKLLNRKKIDAVLITSDDAAVTMCIDNLLQNNLSPLEKYKSIAMYVKKSEATRKLVKNIQPHDRGVSRAAKALKLHPREVRVALEVQGLTGFVRSQLEKSAHANNASMIKKVVAAKSPGEQLRLINGERQKRKKSKPNTLPGNITALMRKWRHSDFRPFYELAKPALQGEFVRATFKEVLE